MEMWLRNIFQGKGEWRNFGVIIQSIGLGEEIKMSKLEEQKMKVGYA